MTTRRGEQTGPVVLKQTHSVMATQSSSASVGSVPSHHSDDSHPRSRSNRTVKKKGRDGTLPAPVLVYHESARSIVFRDHLRRAAEAEHQKQQQQQQQQQQKQVINQGVEDIMVSDNGKNDGDNIINNNNNDDEDVDDGAKIHRDSPRLFSEREKELSQDMASEWNELSHLFGGSDALQTQDRWNVEIQGFQPNIVPLPHLELGANDEFESLLESSPDHTSDDWTVAEREVIEMLQSQTAVVKTIKNTEWTSFLRRFQTSNPPRGRVPGKHNDIPPSLEEGEQNKSTFLPFNSFVTSTSMLPPGARKMRCFGNPSLYTTGVVFALPKFNTPDEETKAVEETQTWSWPSGYSAKTEFNIGSRGELLNGRQEALVSLAMLRKYNFDYLTKDEYLVGGRLVKSSAVKTVPYNEIFVRVGGLGRVVDSIDVASGESRIDVKHTGRSFDRGVGLPVALFVRTPTFGHLISLLRTRARLSHVLGEKHIHGIPLLYFTANHNGIRVLTEKLQHKLLKIASRNLNPFQNQMIAHKTTIDQTDQTFLETKVEELIDLDDTIRETLTPEECVRLAGGFGVSDESIAKILKDAMNQDKQDNRVRGIDDAESHRLQDVVNEGLASAVRSGDYYTSRQLLILYSLVASEGHRAEEEALVDDMTDSNGNSNKFIIRKKSLDSDVMLLKRQEHGVVTTTNSQLPPPPPPPPLDTDRLRSATNSDGLLAVLGAAQVLKAMQDGSAKKRTEESFLAVEEWVEHGEQSMAFRLASWRDQRAAQDDLQIATDNNSSFMAFVSKKAITNRSNFAKQLREATLQTDFSDIRFLRAIYAMVNRMHSPCLRLELLQYVLGLDNRYSIAHVRRSIELAATCLSITAATVDTPAS